MAEHRLMTDAQFAEMEERRTKQFDRIDFLLEALLQKHNCSQSSFRGAMNSCQETLRQPFRSNHISLLLNRRENLISAWQNCHDKSSNRVQE
ncbi:hypothetical protein A2U01_0056261 [Trifolium medium]|uniref:Uncharacterized protein n=1 Tax=Trifolium medium TaxID=97028 RepID=A0A392RGX5_9FABA|nr:hypothetical protein [Trifolium medium]